MSDHSIAQQSEAVNATPKEETHPNPPAPTEPTVPRRKQTYQDLGFNFNEGVDIELVRRLLDRNTEPFCPEHPRTPTLEEANDLADEVLIHPVEKIPFDDTEHGHIACLDFDFARGEDVARFVQFIQDRGYYIANMHVNIGLLEEAERDHEIFKEAGFDVRLNESIWGDRQPGELLPSQFKSRIERELIDKENDRRKEFRARFNRVARRGETPLNRAELEELVAANREDPQS